MVTWKSLVWPNKVLPHWTILHSPSAHIDITVRVPHCFPLSLEVKPQKLFQHISPSNHYQPLPITQNGKLRKVFFPFQQFLKDLLRHEYLLSTIWSNYYQWNCKHCCLQVSPLQGMGAKSLRPVFFNHFYYF